MNNQAILEELDKSRAEHQAALDKIQEIKKREEWLQARRGRFTASEFHRLMGYEESPKYDTELTKGGLSYAHEKYIESITTPTETYTNASMQWGNENEETAALKFIEATGIEIDFFGSNQKFQELGKDLGCTPDGLIGDDGGFESKCPDCKTHDHYLTHIVDGEAFKRVCGQYYWQVQGSMYITGRQYWYFVSYDPRFIVEKEQLHYLKIDRNENDIQKLKTRLQLAIAYRNSMLKKRAKRL